MARSWSGRLTGRPQDLTAQAAQAAQDGAVAAFLDLDRRQSYVNDGVDAAGESSSEASHSVGSSLTRAWEPIKQRAFEASAKYLAAAETHSLLDPADRPTGVDPAAAVAAFTDVHRDLADAAVAVDSFYRKHEDELETARSLRAATPQLSAAARSAAVQAETALGRADADGVAYPSVLTAAGELVDALSALQTAETVGSALDIRHAAAAVHAAADGVDARITTARSLINTVKSSLASVKTRVEVVTTRLEGLPQTRSALLREFSAACSKDLSGADDRARQALAHGRSEWVAASRSAESGDLEQASAQLTGARSQLAAAQSEADSLIERLRLLRATKADPGAAAKATRFKIRDAQLLVVDRGLIAKWGSVLDAQADRIEQAAADLGGTHPDYWSYLQTLHSVEAFVSNVVDRVRGEVAAH